MLHKIFATTPHQNLDINKTDQMIAALLTKKEKKVAFRHAFLKNPDLKGHHGTSYLHLAAKHKLLKEMARLIHYGADVKMKDSAGKTAFEYLSKAEQGKVTCLQTQFRKLIEQMNVDNVKLIARHIFNQKSERKEAKKAKKQKTFWRYFLDNQSQQNNKEKIVNLLISMNNNPLLQPLLDVVKLALLGLHDLSMRQKHTDVNYDSDEDDNEASCFNQYLNISFEPDSITIEKIFHSGANGLEAETVTGAYKNNQIFVGARTSSHTPVDEVVNTFFHELTHFVSFEVFKNHGNPYGLTDNETFDQLLAQLKTKIKTGDVTIKVLKDVFKLYPEKNHARELIACIIELLIKDNGIQLLKSQAPELLTFYETCFLPVVIKQCKALAERALSGWPEEIVNTFRHRL